MKKNNDECCPEFIPEKWDKKTFKWNHKPFLMETIPTFFHIPFPPMIGKKITQMWTIAEKAKKTEAKKDDTLILFRDSSAFKSEIYLSVTEPVSEGHNTELSGTFIGKVYDGSYSSIPKFIKENDQYLATQKKKAKDYFIHYAYCPKCAEKYGKNYMILFAQV